MDLGLAGEKGALQLLLGRWAACWRMDAVLNSFPALSFRDTTSFSGILLCLPLPPWDLLVTSAWSPATTHLNAAVKVPSLCVQKIWDESVRLLAK